MARTSSDPFIRPVPENDNETALSNIYPPKVESLNAPGQI
jgi:hypothetical protein